MSFQVSIIKQLSPCNSLNTPAVILQGTENGQLQSASSTLSVIIWIQLGVFWFILYRQYTDSIKGHANEWMVAYINQWKGSTEVSKQFPT